MLAGCIEIYVFNPTVQCMISLGAAGEGGRKLRHFFCLQLVSDAVLCMVAVELLLNT